jgi:hypothetical protein
MEEHDRRSKTADHKAWLRQESNSFGTLRLIKEILKTVESDKNHFLE